MNFTGPSRRQFLASSLKAGVAMKAGPILSSVLESQPSLGDAGSGNSSSVLSVDLRRLVSGADLHYTEPARRSEEGVPIGNGRMGSLLWTEPTTIKLQINRVDVFAEDCNTNSFPERHTDYGSSCGYVDIDFGDYGEDIFAGADFSQSLHVYDGVSDVDSKDVSARTLACVNHDVFAIEVDDRRVNSSPVKIDLRMLRHAIQYLPGQNYQLTAERSVKIVTRNHSATSRPDIRDGCILLIQTYEEGEFHNSSAVAIKVVGRRSKAKYANDATVRLGIAPGRGKWMALIASAATFDRNVDPGEKAVAELNAVDGRSFSDLETANRAWWHDFWSRSFVHLEGPGDTPKEIQKHYTYFLYLMGATSRGAYMPRFGGMLWFSNGDMREWGSQYWWSNQSCYYNGLSPANRPELLEPMFSTYSGMRENCARAAHQQWGSEGIYIPETTWFNGLEALSDEMAAEVRDLFLLKKPWNEHSAAFYKMAGTKLGHNSRWNWKENGKWISGHYEWRDRGYGPYGPVTHIFSSGAQIAYLYWVQYEHLQDRSFLQAHAYPMLKGIAEFYRNHPNLQRGEDGRYHILHVNNSEPVWGARDTQEEMAAMMGIFPIAVRASGILGIDEGLRMKWHEIHENLAGLPSNASAGAPKPQAHGEPEIWISGLPPVINGSIGAPRLIPALHFDLCCAETTDAHRTEVGNNTFAAMFPKGVDPSTVVTVLSTDATAAANLGRGEDMRYLLANQIDNSDPGRGFCDRRGSGPPAILANRMTLREGPGAIGAERLGRMTAALHTALLQSNPPEPGGDPILRVFPAWPREWNAQFTLSARGGFLITASFANGAVEFVELKARVSGDCRLRNPWKSAAAVLFRNGHSASSLHGELFQFPVAQSETVIVAPAGSSLATLRKSI